MFNMYKPVFVDRNLVPDDILKIIRCKCLKNCKSNCGWIKHGLKCSEFCVSCRGENCSYKQETTDLPEENQDEGEADPIVEQNEQDVQIDDVEITYDIPVREDLYSCNELDLVENDNSDNESLPSKRSKLI